ncbi:MAG: hypothetical protein IKW77_09090 [Salinivirgaceae bacterium]|nr:hypothetical protein [Salinivirgaceae bacterium]
MGPTLKYILTVFCIAFAMTADAQGKMSKKSAIQHITGDPYEHYYTMFDGVPFYHDEWLTGSVTMKSGETYDGLQLRYDEYKDDLIYQNDLTNSVIIIDKKSIEQFTLTLPKNGEVETFKPIEHQNLKNQSGRYFAIILEDSISVIKKHEAKEDKYSNVNMTLKKTGAFVHKESRYTWDGNELKAVPKFRRLLLRQYPTHKDELRKLFFHNHIRMKNDNDVKLLYQEINRFVKGE